MERLLDILIDIAMVLVCLLFIVFSVALLFVFLTALSV